MKSWLAMVDMNLDGADIPGLTSSLNKMHQILEKHISMPSFAVILPLLMGPWEISMTFYITSFQANFAD